MSAHESSVSKALRLPHHAIADPVAGGGGAGAVAANAAAPLEASVHTAVVFVPVSQHPIFAVSRHTGDISYTPNSVALLEAIGGLPAVARITTRFYRKFHADRYLKQFLGSTSQGATSLEQHAERLARYICEMMGGTRAIGKTPWTDEMSRRPRCPIRLADGSRENIDSRAGAHFCAWNSIDRPADRVGRRFKLEDCRVWMRLLFWSAREEGFEPLWLRGAPATHVPFGADVDAKTTFFHYLVCWAAHFIAIYESTARAFAAHEAKWSSNTNESFRHYSSLGDGERFMRDAVGVPLNEASASMPAEDRVMDSDLYRNVQV